MIKWRLNNNCMRGRQRLVEHNTLVNRTMSSEQHFYGLKQTEDLYSASIGPSLQQSLNSNLEHESLEFSELSTTGKVVPDIIIHPYLPTGI